jgi:hypothetical protein
MRQTCIHWLTLGEMSVEVNSATDGGSNGEVNEEFEPPPHPKHLVVVHSQNSRHQSNVGHSFVGNSVQVSVTM